jgi:hypothetical protein
MRSSFLWGEPSTNRERINEWGQGFVHSLTAISMSPPRMRREGFHPPAQGGGEVLSELGGELRVHGRLLSHW